LEICHREMPPDSPDMGGMDIENAPDTTYAPDALWNYKTASAKAFTSF